MRQARGETGWFFANGLYPFHCVPTHCLFNDAYWWFINALPQNMASLQKFDRLRFLDFRKWCLTIGSGRILKCSSVNWRIPDRQARIKYPFRRPPWKHLWRTVYQLLHTNYTLLGRHPSNLNMGYWANLLNSHFDFTGEARVIELCSIN